MRGVQHQLGHGLGRLARGVSRQVGAVHGLPVEVHGRQRGHVDAQRLGGIGGNRLDGTLWPSPVIHHLGGSRSDASRGCMFAIGSEGQFDVVTSSLAFDYAEDFCDILKKIFALLIPGGKLVFSTSHPLSTAYDGVYDRYTRTPEGERLYANLHNYNIEGLRKFRWNVDDYEVYHRRFSTLINNIVSAGFIIEECHEANLPEEIIEKYPDKFGGLYHQPDFIFFRCGRHP